MLLGCRSRTIGKAAWSLPRRNVSCTYTAINRQHRNKYHSKALPLQNPPPFAKRPKPLHTGIINVDSIMTIPPKPSSPSPSPSSPTIKTRILIISDTHSTVPQTKEDNPADTEDELNTPGGPLRVPTGFRFPLPEADVVLHCGDLTRRGAPIEIRKTFSMLRGLRSPLKLVIAGNHDTALDKMHIDNQDDEGLEEHSEALQIAKEAEEDGVKYLTEGTYSFDLPNGARLRIFTSPYTPKYGYWAFQYETGEHNFDIPSDVDIAMTHGPPLGILDRTSRKDNAGCGTLFRSLYHARPQIHCFGHIHEAWGAELMQWKPEPDSLSLEGSATTLGGETTQSIISPATVLDRENSRLVYTLTPPPMTIPTNTNLIDMEAHERLLEMSKDRGCYVDLTEGENLLKKGEQTLFVNASIMSVRYRPSQMPFVVDVDLPRATESNEPEHQLAYKAAI